MYPFELCQYVTFLCYFVLSVNNTGCSEDGRLNAKVFKKNLIKETSKLPNAPQYHLIGNLTVRYTK